MTISIFPEIETVAFTGHRFIHEDEMLAHLADITAMFPNAVWICGGAIGVDSYAAKYAMTHSIPYILILPFPPDIMSKYWNFEQKRLLLETITHAKSVTILSQVYNVKFYQLRNMAMVDAAQVLVAFFDGSSGGTANCVKYAKTKNKEYQILYYSGPFRGSRGKHIRIRSF